MFVGAIPLGLITFAVAYVVVRKLRGKHASRAGPGDAPVAIRSKTAQHSHRRLMVEDQPERVLQRLTIM